MGRHNTVDLDELRAAWEDTEGEDGDTSDKAFDEYLAEIGHVTGEGDIYCAKCDLDIRSPGWEVVNGRPYHTACLEDSGR
jgi:hypothetical protein